MLYPKVIKMIGGENITITEDEFQAIKKELKIKPTGFIEVQGELINKISIAKVGNHHATAFMEKIEGHQKETDLKIKADETKRIEEPDYYLNEYGEKMYS
jgi:hypothetical protein